MKKITFSFVSSLIFILLLSSCVHTTKAPNGDGEQPVTDDSITDMQESTQNSQQTDINQEDDIDEIATNDTTQDVEEDMTELTPEEQEKLKNTQAITEFQNELEDLIITAQDKNE